MFCKQGRPQRCPVRAFLYSDEENSTPRQYVKPGVWCHMGRPVATLAHGGAGKRQCDCICSRDQSCVSWCSPETAHPAHIFDRRVMRQEVARCMWLTTPTKTIVISTTAANETLASPEGGMDGYYHRKSES